LNWPEFIARHSHFDCRQFRRERGRMRVLVVKSLNRFQRRERIADLVLCEAIVRAERGAIDANLGHGLIKQRVARPGQGRSGGFRTIVAYRSGLRAEFLLGFAKSSRANIAPDELKDLAATGVAWLGASDEALESNAEAGRIRELDCDGTP
jgi:hypothetical protein